MSRRTLALGLLESSLLGCSLFGCNPLFGIEEGVLREDPDDVDQFLVPDSGATPAAPNATPAAPNAGPVLTAPLLFNEWSVAAGAPLDVFGRAHTAGGASATLTPSPNCSAGSCFQGQPPDGLCWNGHMDGVPANADDAYYSLNWGTEIGLELRNPGNGAAWDRAGGRVLGVAFRVEGARIPPFRFNVNLPPTPDGRIPIYCQDLLRGEAFSDEIAFDSLVASCWNGARSPLLERQLGMTQFSWNIPPIATAIDFDFCVRDIRLIVAE